MSRACPLLRPKFRRRRKHAAGFVMAEALVSLAIASLTIFLLTSASWGIKQANELRQRNAAQSMTRWLNARHILQNWASSISAESLGNSRRKIIGSSDKLRLFVTHHKRGSYIIELSIQPDEDQFVLIANRYDYTKSEGENRQNAKSSQLLHADQILRFQYLLADDLGNWTWRYETDPQDGLPRAIALEQDGQRMITAPIPATIDFECLSSAGPEALETGLCRVR